MKFCWSSNDSSYRFQIRLCYVAFPSYKSHCSFIVLTPQGQLAKTASMSREPFSLLLFLLFLLLTSFSSSVAVDTITPTTALKYGQTLISAGGHFELGFFRPSNSSTSRYLGIWYKNIPVQTVVWVANRVTPLNDSFGTLKIGSNGNLVLLNGASEVIWSSNSTNVSNPVAQLLDSGNLVLRAEDTSDSYLWEAFDYPTDSLLAGMKLGWNLKTGLDRYLNAWKSSSDPSPGDYAFKMDPRGSPEMFLYRDSQIIYESGPWNGLQFSGVPDLVSNDILRFRFVSNQDEVYYTYDVLNSSITSRFMLSPTGSLQRLVWIDASQAWNVFWSDPKDQCDSYGLCGPNGVCNANNSPLCSCLPGFEPKSPAEWALRDWSSGCVRTVDLDCPKGDGFLLVTQMRLPVTREAIVDESMSLAGCRDVCLNNCSCTAYSSANISGAGSGCIMWASGLINLRQFAVGAGGQGLYIRLPTSQINNIIMSKTSEKSGRKKQVIVISVSTISILFLLGIGGFCIWKKVKAHSRMTSLPPSSEGPWRKLNVICSAKNHCSGEDQSRGEDSELRLFDFHTLAAATDNYSISNMLGEGGFGPVYRGKLRDGSDIAVKRLSANSSQGLTEFKNEVELIAKLQHRNLVQLLGYCINGERMLIYEFMHNGSLDTFIFDQTKSRQLDWQRRFTIILGIARGLLYLHQDSRFRIIHRDLKASNILLDREMNPKISDFGMARIFGGDQSDARTRRVVGTYGYMSPEYAMDGIFSVKSDIFSFGVLILEIVSGKKNKAIYQSEPHLNLIGYAWRLWKEGKSLELIDELMDGPYTISEVMSCIQVGLLCVQQQAIDRPSISEVITMLGSKNVTLPQPSTPGFSVQKNHGDAESVSSTSINRLTVTMLHGR